MLKIVTNFCAPLNYINCHIMHPCETNSQHVTTMTNSRSEKAFKIHMYFPFATDLPLGEHYLICLNP